MDDNTPAVDNLSYTIEGDEVLVIAGANGSGKTTAMEILCGLGLSNLGPSGVARTARRSGWGAQKPEWVSSCRSVGCLNDSGSARP